MDTQAHPRNPEYDGSIVLNKHDPCCVVRALMVWNESVSGWYGNSREYKFDVVEY